VITSEDSQQTLEIIVYRLNTPGGEFDGVTVNYSLTSLSGSTEKLEINTENTFVFLGGTEQLPTSAYTINTTSSGQVSIYFVDAPPEGTTYDIRTVTSGTYYASQGTFPVEVYSFDDISTLFNSVRTEFPLRYNGVAVNSSVVTSENLFVSLGGAIQLPPQRQYDAATGRETLVQGAYVVDNGKITFVAPPLTGSTCNMRYFGEREFINCPLPGGLSSDFMKWGPGVVLSLQGSLQSLDSGTI
jgi:hypothetical protein